MIDPKRMERLWAACPELRPEVLEICKWHDGSFMAWSFYGLQITSEWSTLQNGEPLLNALIRDKCTLWLSASKTSHGVHIEHEQRGKGEFSVSAVDLYDRDDVKYGAVMDPDPTEACLLACERVLGLPEWNATTSKEKRMKLRSGIAVDKCPSCGSTTATPLDITRPIDLLTSGTRIYFVCPCGFSLIDFKQIPTVPEPSGTHTKMNKEPC